MWREVDYLLAGPILVHYLSPATSQVSQVGDTKSFPEDKLWSILRKWWYMRRGGDTCTLPFVQFRFRSNSELCCVISALLEKEMKNCKNLFAPSPAPALGDVFSNQKVISQKGRGVSPHLWTWQRFWTSFLVMFSLWNLSRPRDSVVGCEDDVLWGNLAS